MEKYLNPDRKNQFQIGKVLQEFLDNSTIGVCVTDMDGRIGEVNPAFCHVIGYDRTELLNRSLTEFESGEDADGVAKRREEIVTSGEARFKTTWKHKNSGLIDVDLNVSSIGLDGRPFWFFFVSGFTELKEIESRTDIINELLKLFLRTGSRKEYLEESLKIIRDWAGISCGGIRVSDDRGNIPFETYTGYSESFIQAENWLSTCRDACLCIRVILGEKNPRDESEMTPAGSFFCNQTLEFVEQLAEADMPHYRGVCMQKGYKSLAIIPIRYGEKILGAIHMADKREGMFPRKNIEFIESSIASIIGEGIYRFSVEDQLQQNLETQTALTSLLKHSLEDLGLEDILKLTLDLVHSSRSFSFGDKSSIYIVEGEPEALILKAAHGFDKNQKKPLRRVPFGESPCGKAAFTRETQFTEGSLARSGGQQEGWEAPGYYSVPILLAKNTLGVMNIYLEEGHHRHPEEEAFLSAVADTLAGIIWRKRSEEKLKSLSRRLVSVQEEERRAIALELHDQIGQMLTGLKLMISQAARLSGEIKLTTLEEIQAAVSEIINKVREMSLNLRPSMLDDLGLLPTLHWHFQQTHNQAGLKIDFRHSGIEKPFSKEVSIAAYRIIQEALTNVTRHAGVKDVLVNAWEDDGRLHIRIEDKGVGFIPAKVSMSTSTGLQGMRERAMLLGGRLAVESSPGAGTVGAAELPLQERPAKTEIKETHN